MQDNNKPIAFVLDNLAASQISHSAIYQINKYLAENSHNVSVFFLDTAMPCLVAGFAVHHVRDAGHFYGTLIATSLKTMVEIKDCTRCARYYYVNELEWKRPWFSKQDKMDFTNIMLDKGIGKFCRSHDHANVLSDEFAVNSLSESPIEHFQMDKILEIING